MRRYLIASTILVGLCYIPIKAQVGAAPNGGIALASNGGALNPGSGGTGISSYTIGDLLYASATTTLSKLADVATGQVLVSGGVATAPAYSTTPSVTSLTVKSGTSTDTLKTGGIVGQLLTSITDASVQNQWNVGSVALAANTLAVNGDTLIVNVAYTLAANANTKPYQLYFAPSTATCSGSGATLCDAGCQIQSNSSTGSGLSAIDIYTITRTSSGNQKYYGTLPITSSIQRTDLGTCTITDTAASKIAFGIRNNDAAAASISSSIINIWYYGR